MNRYLGALGACLILLLFAGLAIPGFFGAPMGQGSGQALAAPVPARAPPRKPAPPAVQLPPPVAQVLQSGVLIVVSKASQRMFVFKDGALWDQSPVSTGKRGHSTPAGVFPILQKRKFHRSNLYSNAPMPFMQRLTWSGIAIHAGHLPGYPASHGCIRLPHAFAKALFAITRFESTTVVVTNAVVTSDGAARTLALNTPVPGATRPGAVQPVPAQAATPRIEPLPTIPVQPGAAPTRGQTIQLAAAGSPDEAYALWRDLSTRHPQLLRTQHMVIPARVGARQVYRLRVTAPDAFALCSELKRSGTACFNVS